MFVVRCVWGRPPYEKQRVYGFWVRRVKMAEEEASQCMFVLDFLLQLRSRWGTPSVTLEPFLNFLLNNLFVRLHPSRTKTNRDTQGSHRSFREGARGRAWAHGLSVPLCAPRFSFHWPSRSWSCKPRARLERPQLPNSAATT